MDRRFVFIVTPTAPVSARIAIAGCRAGATGVLDLSFLRADDAAAITCLDQLERHAASTGYGVQLDAGLADWAECLPARAGLRVVVVAQDAWVEHPEAARRIRETGWELWLQLTSLDHVDGAMTLEPAGYVLKGHESGGAVGAGNQLRVASALARAVRRRASGAGGRAGRSGGLTRRLPASQVEPMAWRSIPNCC